METPRSADAPQPGSSEPGRKRSTGLSTLAMLALPAGSTNGCEQCGGGPATEQQFSGYSARLCRDCYADYNEEFLRHPLLNARTRAESGRRAAERGGNWNYAESKAEEILHADLVLFLHARSFVKDAPGRPASESEVRAATGGSIGFD